MREGLQEHVIRCLAAVEDLGTDQDEQSAWLASLEALARNVNFPQAHVRQIRMLLDKKIPADARVILTRILVSSAQDHAVSEFFDDYLQALAQVSHERRMSDAGVLGAFFRGDDSSSERWRKCVEVLGINTAVSLLSGVPDIAVPDEATMILTESKRVEYRTNVIWDFVMAASPSAWRHTDARRPDFRAKYWFSLLDWPFDGTGTNSSELVARKVLSEREAQVLESFGAKLRINLCQYNEYPGEAALTASPSLHAIGERALQEFFGSNFQEALESIYSGP